MKKLLSILMALALCLSFTVLAFAENEDTDAATADEVVTAETPDEDDGAVTTGVIDAEAEAEAVGERVEEAINDATDAFNKFMQDNNISGDAAAFAQKLKDYIDKAEIDPENNGKVIAAVEDFMKMYLKDGGFDLEAIETDLKDENSALSKIVGLYAGIYQNTPETTPETPETPETPDSPEVPNPPTGESTTGAIAALAVLAVSAAAFVVCTKKKED